MGSLRLENIGWFAKTLRANTHLRYSAARVLSSALPPFSAGPIIPIIYRWAGFSIGANATFLGPVRIVSGLGFEENLSVGDRVLISTDVTINVDGQVTVGDGASIGPFVRIYTGTHRTGPSTKRMLDQPVPRPVTIGQGAWLRVGAWVMPGVTIGDGAVIGAGSVVTTDVEPNTYVEGNPARPVRELD